MDDTLVQMVRLRDMINDNQKRIKDDRANLKSITASVLEYMNAKQIKTITNVDGNFTVSLATSQRLPPLNLEFVQACLLRYLETSSNSANAADAANYVFEQRKNNKQTVMRVQVRKQTNNKVSAQLLPTQLVEDENEDEDEDENEAEEPTYTAQTAFQF